MTKVSKELLKNYVKEQNFNSSNDVRIKYVRDIKEDFEPQIIPKHKRNITILTKKFCYLTQKE